MRIYLYSFTYIYAAVNNVILNKFDIGWLEGISHKYIYGRGKYNTLEKEIWNGLVYLI